MKLELDHEFIINIKDECNLSKECEMILNAPVSTGTVVKMEYLKHKGWQTPEICSENVQKLSPYQEYWLNKYSKAHIIASKDNDGIIQVFRVAETWNEIMNECRRLSIPLIDEDLFTDCVRAMAEIHSKWIPAADDKVFHMDIYIIETYEMNDIQFQFFITSELRLESNFSLEMFSCKESDSLLNKGNGKDNSIQVNLCGDEGFIGNCSDASVFIYMNGKVITPSAPLGSGIYSDLMRDSVITLLESEGIEVIERQITADECISANDIGGIDEIFVAGIENGVQFITRWQHNDHLLVSSSASNSGFLRNNIRNILCGKQEDLYRWVIYCNKHH